jgi:hypothetical protein
MKANMSRSRRTGSVSRILGIRRFRSNCTNEDRTREFWHLVDVIFRHPAVLGSLGFLFAGAIGGWIQDRQHEAERKRTEVASAIAAIDRVSLALSEFQIRSFMYADRRLSVDSARLLKEMDESFVTLNAGWSGQVTVIAAPFKEQIVRGVFARLRPLLESSSMTATRLANSDTNELKSYFQNVTWCVDLALRAINGSQTLTNSELGLAGLIRFSQTQFDVLQAMKLYSAQIPESNAEKFDCQIEEKRERAAIDQKPKQ